LTFICRRCRLARLKIIDCGDLSRSIARRTAERTRANSAFLTVAGKPDRAVSLLL
jgi:hypothetical protein